jgi:hypothetical protein
MDRICLNRLLQFRFPVRLTGIPTGIERPMLTWLRDNAIQLVNPIITVVGIILGTLTVVWQLGRQHKSSLDVQRETKREELELQIYETLVQRINALSNALTDASMYVFSIPSNIEFRQMQSIQGRDFQPLEQRAPVFSNLHHQAVHEVAVLLVEFESWLIAFPGARVFQIALKQRSSMRGRLSPLSFRCC